MHVQSALPYRITFSKSHKTEDRKEPLLIWITLLKCFVLLFVGILRL